MAHNSRVRKTYRNQTINISYIYIYINHGTIFLLFSTSLEIMCPQNQYYAFLFDNKILFSHS